MAVLIFRAAEIISASRLTNAIDAELIADAVSRTSAKCCAYTSVAHRTGCALRVSLAILERRASKIRITCAARLTGAHRAMIERGTISSMSANVRKGARIDAFMIEARIRLTAVAMIVALQMNALRCWISCCLSRTFADWNVITCKTLRISTANSLCIAWISASIIDAGG